MIKNRQLNRLHIVRDTALRMRELLACEIRYKQNASDHRRQLLALDFDVVFDYLHAEHLDPDSTTELADDSIQLANSLLQLEEVIFTILPGSLHQFANHFSHLLGQLPRFKQSSDLLDHLRHRYGVRHGRKLRDDLLGLFRDSTLGLCEVRRAKRLLESDNYRNLEEIYPAVLDLARHSRFFDSCFAHLEMSRSTPRRLETSPRRRLANHNDSTDLTIVLSALQSASHLTLATRSRLVVKAFESTWQDRYADQSVPPAVLSPRLGLFRVGLRNAPLPKLLELEEALVTIQPRIDDYWRVMNRPSANADAIGLSKVVADCSQAVLDLLGSLTDLHSSIGISWSRPAKEVPDDIDLDKLAEDVLLLGSEVQEEIRRLLSTARHLFVTAASVVGSLATRALAAQESIPLLEAAADSNRILYVEKLVYVGQGGTMVDKSIRQNAGRDLNAAIDSFNGNVVEIGSSGKAELEAKLGDFLEAIVSSSLSDTDKTTILTEAQTVAREAAANGKLVGRAQLLWTGIKEVISNVPKAVTAWESLSKLWSELPK